jgi:hypothetical protein
MTAHRLLADDVIEVDNLERRAGSRSSVPGERLGIQLAHDLLSSSFPVSRGCG